MQKLLFCFKYERCCNNTALDQLKTHRNLAVRCNDRLSSMPPTPPPPLACYCRCYVITLLLLLLSLLLSLLLTLFLLLLLNVIVIVWDVPVRWLPSRSTAISLSISLSVLRTPPAGAAPQQGRTDPTVGDSRPTAEPVNATTLAWHGPGWRPSGCYDGDDGAPQQGDHKQGANGR